MSEMSIRERVREGGRRYLKQEAWPDFDDLLAGTDDVLLDVWLDRAADARISSGEPGEGEDPDATFVASIIWETQ